MASKPKALAGIGGTILLLAGAFLGLNPDSLDGGGSSAPETSKMAANTTAAAKPSARPSHPATTNGNECPVETLPKEVNPVIDGILAGAKPKYPENDGVRFGNYEGNLPKQDRNFYREYTVDTPGLGHRGARRIVTGGGSTTDPDVWYYTDDHYDSFCEIPDAE